MRVDEDHCANQGDPGTYCNERHQMLYCSKCRSETNGCRQEQPDTACDVTGPVAGTETSTTTETTGGSMSNTSVDPVTTTEPTMTMSTTESMDSTTEDIEPGCGNGVREQALDENCDTDDIPAMNCADVGLMPGDTDGSVGCYPQDHALECLYDLTGCSGVAVCGNSMIEGTEQCDMNNLDDETCATLSDDYIGGTLTCTGMNDPNPCTFNTSQCELCRAGGDDCTVDSQCCTGNCVTLLMADECSAI